MAHMTFLSLSLLLLILVNISHQNFGRCPSKSYVKGFPFFQSQFQGVWYEYARKGSPIWGSLTKCNRFEFSENSTDSSFSMVVPLAKCSIKIPLRVDKVVDTEDDFNAHFMWNFKIPLHTVNREVYILSTDFDVYALVWSCKNYLFWNCQTAWILIRDNPSKLQLWVAEYLQKEVAAAGFHIKDFTIISHENCEATSSCAVNGLEAMGRP